MYYSFALAGHRGTCLRPLHIFALLCFALVNQLVNYCSYYWQTGQTDRPRRQTGRAKQTEYLSRLTRHGLERPSPTTACNAWQVRRHIRFFSAYASTISYSLVTAARVPCVQRAQSYIQQNPRTVAHKFSATKHSQNIGRYVISVKR